MGCWAQIYPEDVDLDRAREMLEERPNICAGCGLKMPALILQRSGIVMRGPTSRISMLCALCGRENVYVESGGKPGKVTCTMGVPGPSSEENEELIPVPSEALGETPAKPG